MFLKFLFLSLLFSSFLYSALLKDIELKFKPTSSLSDYENMDLSNLSSTSISLGSFSDEREEKGLIGENREDEDKGKVLPVTTKTPVSDFLKETYKKLLKDIGIKIVDGSPKTLEAKVIKFFAEEKNLYRAEVWLEIELKKDGALIFEERIMGSAKRFGRSYKLENYFEVLSDAIIDSFASLFQNEGFLKALKQ